MGDINLFQVRQFSLLGRLLYESRGVLGYVKYPYIYFRKDIYENLKSDKPDPVNKGMLLHEFRHIERMEEIGVFKFKMKYIFSLKFRLQEELEADKVRFRYFKDNNVAFDLEGRARRLSGIMYLWMISYPRAIQLINEVWDNA